MDVRLGVSFNPKEITVELGDDADPKKVRAELEKVMCTDNGVFWLTDRRGRQIGVPVDKLSYVDIGSHDTSPKVGFGS